MNVKETILNQHKTLKRIEELQEFMHGTSKLAFNLDEAGIVEQPEEKEGFFLAVLIFSHVLEDVLDGKDVAEAVGDAIFQDEDEE